MVVGHQNVIAQVVAPFQVEHLMGTTQHHEAVQIPLALTKQVCQVDFFCPALTDHTKILLPRTQVYPYPSCQESLNAFSVLFPFLLFLDLQPF